MDADELIAEINVDGLAEVGGMKPRTIEEAIRGSKEVRDIAEELQHDQSIETARNLIVWSKGYRMGVTPG